MLNSGKSSFIGEKEVVLGQSIFTRAKVVYSAKGGSYRGKVVVFGQKLLYSSKIGCGCFRAKMVEFQQNWLYSGKVVVFGQEYFYSGKSGCIWAKRLYSGKGGCNRAK